MTILDLREASGLKDWKVFNQSYDELQAAMIVIPSEVLYQPQFTYIWTLVETRFQKQWGDKLEKVLAFREIADVFLSHAGMIFPGELARMTGGPRPDVGLGHKALVESQKAIRIEKGKYLYRSRDLLDFYQTVR
ncbi:MAG: hypothetical protein JST85_29210 [Acidobacteria bacterium]|nr:hypothetical protein [Acidobacteriota bacterium]